MRFVAPTVDLEAHAPERAVLQLAPKRLCEEHGVVPVCIEDGALVVAVSEPDDATIVVAEIERTSGRRVKLVRASIEAIRAAILRWDASPS